MNHRNFQQAWRAVSKGFFGLAVVALMGCHAEEKPKAPEAPAPKVEGDQVTFLTNAPQLSSIVVESAQPRTLAITHLTGRLYWNDESTVRVFTPLAGRVKAIMVDLGDKITAGEPMAEIDSPDFSMALANVRTADGSLATLEKAYNRSKELLEHGAAAQKDVEAAEAAYVAAKAESERAKAVLLNYGGENGANSLYILRAPLGGVLVDKNLTPGQEIRADLMLANAPNLFAPLFVISAPSKLWLQLDVSETDLANLRAGMELRIYSRAFPDKVFKGRVDKIGDSLDPSLRTVKIRGVVENPDLLLKAEMYVQVDVAQDVSKVAGAGVEIPAKAIFMQGSDSFLFVERSPGQYLRKKVALGQEKDGKVPVFEGVEAGEKVVVEGALLLQSIVSPAS